MSKNIVVFSDGTGQIGGKGANTNVYRLFNMVEDRTPNQISFYDPGLGTDTRFFTGKLFGNGFSDNVMDCYQFLFQNYEAGDKVFLFGFSRGAATVRSLASFLHLYGILPKSRPDLVKKAFKLYRITDQEERVDASNEFISKNHTMWVKVHFLGVYDTVAALGVPSNPLDNILDIFFRSTKFHNFDLPESVVFGRHAISIDDQRKTFFPILWNKVVQEKDYKGRKHPDDRVKQVWFSGVHTDVGGGYEKADLSNISLDWMLQEAFAKGLRIYKYSPSFKYINEWDPKLGPDGTMHDEQKAGIFKYLTKRFNRSYNAEKCGTICLHESVLQRKKNRDNGDDSPYKPWLKNFIDEKQYTVEPWNHSTNNWREHYRSEVEQSDG